MLEHFGPPQLVCSVAIELRLVESLRILSEAPRIGRHFMARGRPNLRTVTPKPHVEGPLYGARTVAPVCRVVVCLGFLSSGHHPASRRATNAQLTPAQMFKLLPLLSTLRFGCQVRPEENYVHRGCVFNSLIKRNGTPDMAQCSQTAPPLSKWRELRPAPVCLL